MFQKILYNVKITPWCIGALIGKIWFKKLKLLPMQGERERERERERDGDTLSKGERDYQGRKTLGRTQYRRELGRQGEREMKERAREKETCEKELRDRARERQCERERERKRGRKRETERVESRWRRKKERRQRR